MDAFRRIAGVASIAGDKPRPAVAAVVAVAVLATAAGVAGLAGALGGDGPEAAVRAFFAARHDEDCERLLDLVSEASRSRGGELDRDGFVEECGEVVGAYGPELDDVDIVRVGDDRAVVAVTVEVAQGTVPGPDARDGLVVHDYPGGPDTVHATGTLVREQGRWRVETDLGLLRIGRSPNEVLAAYVEARALARCDDVADLLSEDARRAAGATDRAGFVERCEATTTPDDGLGLVPPALRFELAEHDGRITAVAPAADGYGTGLGTETGPSAGTVTLVADGLGWRLDRDLAVVIARGLRGLIDPPGEAYMPDIEELMVPGANTPSSLVRDEGTDAAERRSEAGFEGGAIVRFTDAQNYVTVLLYQFATPEGAVAHAEHLAGRVAANHDDARAPAATPGVPFRTVLDCGQLPDCSRAEGAFALDSDGGYLVAVEVTDYIDPDPTATDILARAMTLVETQLAAL